jgi:arsenite methyltransferase
MIVTHEQIAEEYGNAVTGDKRGLVAQTGNAKFAGYSVAEIQLIPEGVAETSFGCGNPVAFSEVQLGQTVLDLGCGGGFDLILAAGKVGAAGKVIGVDMTDKMLSLARQNIAKSGFSNIEVKKGKIEALPIDSESVDWVISNCVINCRLKSKPCSKKLRVYSNQGVRCSYPISWRKICRFGCGEVEY